MWCRVLGRLLVLAVLTPGFIPFAPAAAGPECLCSERACCRESRGEGAASCHRAAPLLPDAALRCAHGLHEWAQHVVTTAPLPAPVSVSAAPAAHRLGDTPAPRLHELALPPPGPPPRPPVLS